MAEKRNWNPKNWKPKNPWTRKTGNFKTGTPKTRIFKNRYPYNRDLKKTSARLYSFFKNIKKGYLNYYFKIFNFPDVMRYFIVKFYRFKY